MVQTLRYFGPVRRWTYSSPPVVADLIASPRQPNRSPRNGFASYRPQLVATSAVWAVSNAATDERDWAASGTDSRASRASFISTPGTTRSHCGL